MNSPGRLYNRGEKPSSAISNVVGPNKIFHRLGLRTGTIREVDTTRLRMYIEWKGGSGTARWIPISFPVFGPASCLGMIPEVGSVGIFGFYFEGDGTTSSPFLLAYLPAYLTASYQYNDMKLDPDAIPNEDQNIFQYRFRPLTEGEMCMVAPKGASLYASTGLEITDKMKDSILVRDSDQAIIATSLNNFIFADGVAISAGPIIRNHLNLFDTTGKRIPSTLARELTLPDGRTNIHLTPFGDKINYDSQYYSEYRIDANDLVDGTLDINSINTPGTTSMASSIISLVMGNYVGSDISRKDYGKIVRPSLFNSPQDQDGDFTLSECVQNKGADEVALLGLAYALHSTKSGCFIGVDKEGHYYMHLPSSAAHPLGGGRSMSILAKGNLKEIWGADGKEANSWDLTAKGGVRWNVGAHNDTQKNRSIDIRASSSIFIQAGGQDTENVTINVDGTDKVYNFAKQENILGNSREVVAGTQFQAVSGDQRTTISGLKSESVFGSASYQFQTDKSENIMGISHEVVGKEKQGNYAKRTVTIKGKDELIIQGADRIETIQLFGNRKTSLLGAGNIEENIFKGDKKVTITAGDYKISVAAGNINITTAIGSAKISASTGITIDAGLASSVAIKGMGVTLGNSIRETGVVTGNDSVSCTHHDYMTGSPLLGSFTVKTSA